MIEFTIQKITFSDIPTVRLLFREYEKMLGVSLCFQDFENEIATLPGVYAEPAGAIFKLTVNDKIVGVVALKPLSATECEMKRLYIRDEFKGKGLGNKMTRVVMKAGRGKGYKLIKLDTLARLATAVELYRKLGFIETQPYNYNPHGDILYFEKQL